MQSKPAATTKIINYTLELDGTPWCLVVPDGASTEWCVLWLQGFISTIEDHTEGVVRMAEASSTAFAMLNYAGHGDNPIALSDATRTQQFDEVCAVYDELKKLGYRKIIANGGSFGGYMIALLTGARPLEAAVLRAPANYPDNEFQLPYRDTAAGKDVAKHNLYLQQISPEYRNTAVDTLANYDGPTFVVEHGADEVIHSPIPKSYYNVAKHGSYIVIPGLKHAARDMPNPAHYYAIVEAWVETIIKIVRMQELRK
ncbi:hypothetical protein KBD87_00640 [Candidatus Saccharibacteria bacterium]|nr:hypothetical protein [Candidatus Saccharibacteria bacterium]